MSLEIQKEREVIGYELYEAKRDKRGIYHIEKITTYQTVNAYTEFLNKPENREKWHNGYFRIQPIYAPVKDDEDNKKTVLTGTIADIPSVANLPHIETPDRNKLEWNMTFKLTDEQRKEIEKYIATLKPWTPTLYTENDLVNKNTRKPDDTNEDNFIEKYDFISTKKNGECYPSNKYKLKEDTCKCGKNKKIKLKTKTKVKKKTKRRGEFKVIP